MSDLSLQDERERLVEFRAAFSATQTSSETMIVLQQEKIVAALEQLDQAREALSGVCEKYDSLVWGENYEYQAGFQEAYEIAHKFLKQQEVE